IRRALHGLGSARPCETADVAVHPYTATFAVMNDAQAPRKDYDPDNTQVSSPQPLLGGESTVAQLAANLPARAWEMPLSDPQHQGGTASASAGAGAGAGAG